MLHESENKVDALFEKIKILEGRIAELESSVYAINWDLIATNQRFFNEYLSVFYEFEDDDLVNFHKHLITGHEFSQPDIDYEPFGVGQARYGLAFNRNIIWSEKVVELFDNFLLNKEDVKNYPHQILEQVKSHFYFEDLRFTKRNFSLDIVNLYASPEDEYYERLFDDFEILFSQVEFACNIEIHRRYNRIFNKSDFTRRDVIEIIEVGETDYFCNNAFIQKFKEMIAELKDFNLDSFYRLKTKR
jgi:hypothetical protein